MTLKPLENQVGILDILVYLAKNKKSYISELVEKAHINKNSVYYALRKLNEQGLVYDEPETGFGRPRRWIYLTDKGKKVAEELVKIEKILKEE